MKTKYFLVLFVILIVVSVTLQPANAAGSRIERSRILTSILLISTNFLTKLPRPSLACKALSQITKAVHRIRSRIFLLWVFSVIWIVNFTVKNQKEQQLGKYHRNCTVGKY